MNRRWSVLSALLVTALLMYCMPGLLTRHLGGTGRTDDRLKPAPSRTMVVWVTSWMEEDRTLISSLCSAFEKQQPGLRIFLRRVDAAELYAPDAVLPDVVLHATGDVLSPGDALLPLALPEGFAEDAVASGRSQGSLYGVPLWYSPMVFSVPKAWFNEEDGTQTQPSATDGQAYFTLETPVPKVQEEPVTFADVPWRRLTETGHIVSESGIGLAQLTLQCPLTIREELRRLTPEIRKPQTGEAAVCSLASHMAREQDNHCLLMSPPAGQRVRYVSLCREGEDAQAFVRFLLQEEAQTAAVSAHLLPMVTTGIADNTLAAQMISGGEPFLPNAFQMDVAAMDQLCIQGFHKGEDPVATLLKLR